MTDGVISKLIYKIPFILIPTALDKQRASACVQSDATAVSCDLDQLRSVLMSTCTGHGANVDRSGLRRDYTFYNRVQRRSASS